MTKIQLSIVIPVYNEEKIITKTLQIISDFFKDITHEFIIIDDGSNDRTYESITELKNPNIKIFKNYKNYGKGFAIKRGILHSKGEKILCTDADLSTPIEEFIKLKKAIKDGYDIAFGSRLLRESIIEKNQPLLRVILGKFYGLFAHFLISYSIKDTQCGFKLFKGEVARKIFAETKVHGYSFDLEVVLIAKKMGFKITEVPVRWKHYNQSKIKILSFIYFKIIKELFTIFVNKIYGYY